MAIRLGDDAPDFTIDTTEGTVDFLDWKKGSWAVLFSHPKDYTPVCTTELGTVAKLKDEWAKRNVKVIGLSVDPIEDHRGWAGDIEETQGARVVMVSDLQQVYGDAVIEHTFQPRYCAGPHCAKSRARTKHQVA